ncbi:MAG: hypothetical protein HY586_07580 [Candidatus Omnitrophica bacterium]|nr:hypothetical protein [Candidatus Omnitrophota bacterium]
MKKSIALVVAFLILFQPAGFVRADIIFNSGISISPSSPSFFTEMNVPRNLGDITYRSSALSGSRPTVIHIQDAHSRYGVQKNVQRLVEHLSDRYGIRLLFSEGSQGKLDARHFHFFEDPSLNLGIAEDLMRDGEFDGLEMFILRRAGEREKPQPAAYGIENPELYSRNFHLFRGVLSRKNQSGQFMNQIESKLNSLSAHIFSKQLRALVKEWRAYRKENSSDVMRFVEVLTREASTSLSLDLGEPANQDRYPSLVRWTALKQMEAKLNVEQAAREKKELEKFLSGKIDQKLLNDFSSTPVSPAEFSNSSLKASLRFLLEKIHEAIGDKNLDFKKYPAFSAYAACVILQSEIDAAALFREMETLTQNIFSVLAQTPEEKNLLSLVRDTDFLKKLLHLELTRAEFNFLRARPDSTDPEQIVNRLSALMGQAPIFAGKNIDSIAKNAMNFYSLAKEREEYFAQQVSEIMKGRDARKSILFTGGFHTEGLISFLEAKGISVISISPKADGGQVEGVSAAGNEPYVQAMLGGLESADRALAEESLLKSPGFLAAPSAQRSLTQRDPEFLRAYRLPQLEVLIRERKAKTPAPALTPHAEAASLGEKQFEVPGPRGLDSVADNRAMKPRLRPIAYRHVTDAETGERRVARPGDLYRENGQAKQSVVVLPSGFVASSIKLFRDVRKEGEFAINVPQFTEFLQAVKNYLTGIERKTREQEKALRFILMLDHVLSTTGWNENSGDMAPGAAAESVHVEAQKRAEAEIASYLDENRQFLSDFIPVMGRANLGAYLAQAQGLYGENAKLAAYFRAFRLLAFTVFRTDDDASFKLGITLWRAIYNAKTKNGTSATKLLAREQHYLSDIGRENYETSLTALIEEDDALVLQVVNELKVSDSELDAFLAKNGEELKKKLNGKPYVGQSASDVDELEASMPSGFVALTLSASSDGQEMQRRGDQALRALKKESGLSREAIIQRMNEQVAGRYEWFTDLFLRLAQAKVKDPQVISALKLDGTVMPADLSPVDRLYMALGVMLDTARKKFSKPAYDLLKMSAAADFVLKAEETIKGRAIVMTTLSRSIDRPEPAPTVYVMALPEVYQEMAAALYAQYNHLRIHFEGTQRGRSWDAAAERIEEKLDRLERLHNIFTRLAQDTQGYQGREIERPVLIRDQGLNGEIYKDWIKTGNIANAKPVSAPLQFMANDDIRRKAWVNFAVGSALTVDVTTDDGTVLPVHTYHVMRLITEGTRSIATTDHTAIINDPANAAAFSTPEGVRGVYAKHNAGYVDFFIPDSLNSPVSSKLAPPSSQSVADPKFSGRSTSMTHKEIEQRISELPHNQRPGLSLVIGESSRDSALSIVFSVPGANQPIHGHKITEPVVDFTIHEGAIYVKTLAPKSEQRIFQPIAQPTPRTTRSSAVNLEDILEPIASPPSPEFRYYKFMPLIEDISQGPRQERRWLTLDDFLEEVRSRLPGMRLNLVDRVGTLQITFENLLKDDGQNYQLTVSRIEAVRAPVSPSLRIEQMEQVEIKHIDSRTQTIRITKITPGVLQQGWKELPAEVRQRFGDEPGDAAGRPVLMPPPAPPRPRVRPSVAPLAPRPAPPRPTHRRPERSAPPRGVVPPVPPPIPLPALPFSDDPFAPPAPLSNPFGDGPFASPASPFDPSGGDPFAADPFTVTPSQGWDRVKVVAIMNSQWIRVTKLAFTEYQGVVYVKTDEQSLYGGNNIYQIIGTPEDLPNARVVPVNPKDLPAEVKKRFGLDDDGNELGQTADLFPSEPDPRPAEAGDPFAPPTKPTKPADEGGREYKFEPPSPQPAVIPVRRLPGSDDPIQADGSSLGMTLAGAGLTGAHEAQLYSEIHGRAGAESMYVVARDVTLKIYYLPDSNESVVFFYKRKLGLEPVSASTQSVPVNQAVRLFNQGALRSRILKTFAASQAAENHTPVITFVDDFLTREMAQKLSLTMRPGDLFVAVWNGKLNEDKLPDVLTVFHQMPQIRTRAIREELLSDAALNQMTRRMNVPAIFFSRVGETKDLELALGRSGARVKFNVEKLLARGIDLGEAVSLLKQIADMPSPEARMTHFTRMGLAAKGEYFEVEDGFVDFIETFYQNMLVQGAVSRAA